MVQVSSAIGTPVSVTTDALFGGAALYGLQRGVLAGLKTVDVETT